MSWRKTTNIPIAITPPFDAPGLFARLSFVGNRSRLIRADAQLLRLSLPIRIGGKIFPVTVTFGGSLEEPTAMAIVPNPAGADELEQLLSIIRRMISADVDLEAFYRHAAGDERLGPLTAALRGSKLLLDANPFECLIRTIISQQLNLSFAGTLIERLAELAGEETVSIEGEPMLAFPSAERIAALTVDQLRDRSFSQRKAEYIIDAARNIADGTIDLANFEKLQDEEVIAELIRFRGIGRWTAECLLIFGFGRPDLLPAADIGLRNGIKKVYRLDAQPTAAEVIAMSGSWSPWRTYITYYLWESLRLPE